MKSEEISNIVCLTIEVDGKIELKDIFPFSGEINSIRFVKIDDSKLVTFTIISENIYLSETWLYSRIEKGSSLKFKSQEVVKLSRMENISQIKMFCKI